MVGSATAEVFFGKPARAEGIHHGEGIASRGQRGGEIPMVVPDGLHDDEQLAGRAV